MGFVLGGFAGGCFYLGLISLCLSCFICIALVWFTVILLFDLVSCLFIVFLGVCILLCLCHTLLVLIFGFGFRGSSGWVLVLGLGLIVVLCFASIDVALIVLVWHFLFIFNVVHVLLDGFWFFLGGFGCCFLVGVCFRVCFGVVVGWFS